MKFWALGPLFVGLFSLHTFAIETHEETGSQILLTYAQFSHLTNAEQKTYVKKLREIMVEVSNAFPVVAQEMDSRSSFFAQMWSLNFPEALGEKVPAYEDYIKYANSQTKKYLQDITRTNTKKLSKKDQTLYVEKYRQALLWATSAESITRYMPDKVKSQKLLTKLIEPTRSKIVAMEKNVQPFGDSGYSDVREYFEKAHYDSFDPRTPMPERVSYGERLDLPPNTDSIVKIKPKPHFPSFADDAIKLTPPAVVSKNVDDILDTGLEKKKPVTPPASKTETKKAEPPIDPPTEKTATSEETTGTAKSKKLDIVVYRCIYAGFVIKKGPECKGPSSLPWDLDGLDSSSFVCEKGSIMCNPFLFGFKSSCQWDDASGENKPETCMSSAKPYCVSKGAFATKNCSSLSTSDSALQAAVQLINKNQETYDLFVSSFDELCDKGLIDFNNYEGTRKQKTKEDILRTCETARIRMDAVKLRFMIPKDKNKFKLMPAAEKALNNKNAQ